MKIQFDSTLDFQQDAIKAITDIFEGQETLQTNFTVSRIENGTGLQSFKIFKKL
jgi:type III restriction enzyme